MPSDRWLTKNEYARIRYRAKKMGAVDINLSAIWHHVAFKYTSVSFVFRYLHIFEKISSIFPMEITSKFCAFARSSNVSLGGAKE